MIDIQKQVIYWRDSANEDWQVADELIQTGRFRHGLFLVQLALEKILKAHVCLHTQDLSPRIHNLTRLAEIAALQLAPHQFDVLAEMNTFNIEGRYPNEIFPVLTKEEAYAYRNRAEEVFRWLMSQLP